MKKIFIGIVCCFVLQTNAQILNNTIVNDNSSWATLAYGLGMYNIPYCVSTEYVYFESDSIIEDVSYKKVFSCNDSLHENIAFEGLIREQERKTYFIPADSLTEYLLYDFSLEEGIGFEYWDFRTRESSLLYVITVDSIEVNGLMKKRLQISASPSATGRVLDTWVENLGSLNGILYPCYNLSSVGIRNLLCCYQNEELI